MHRAQRIANQLGVPHGTANNKLRKNLLFKYVKLAGDNFCYKCSLEITSANELSIEHKEPWEGRDAELFWNLNNIAFSHLRCNRPLAQKAGFKREGPEGTSWCYACKKFLPYDCFHKDRARWTGCNAICKECRRNR